MGTPYQPEIQRYLHFRNVPPSPMTSPDESFLFLFQATDVARGSPPILFDFSSVYCILAPQSTIYPIRRWHFDHLELEFRYDADLLETREVVR